MDEKRETPIQAAAKISDDTVTREAKSAAEKLMQKTGDEFWKEFGSYRASDLHTIDTLTGGGSASKGGGSKSKNKKSKKGNKIYTQVWDDH